MTSYIIHVMFAANYYLSYLFAW